ncbi:MAG TPA: hypothetical protein VJY15_06615 [Candidatus Acidoferrum sp.]|nr:hypothetical protein [Candidatus Acidoferrum sp.]
MAEGYRRDHRIGESNRLTCALQVAPDAARKLGRRLIEFEDFLGVDMGKQGENPLRTLDFLGSSPKRVGKKPRLRASKPQDFKGFLASRLFRNVVGFWEA